MYAITLKKTKQHIFLKCSYLLIETQTAENISMALLVSEKSNLNLKTEML